MFDAYDYALATWLAPRSAKPTLRLIFALNVRLRGIIPKAREPLLGQIKLAWWRDQLIALDNDCIPLEPQLMAVSRLIHGSLTGTLLSGLADEERHMATLMTVVNILCGEASRSAALLTQLSQSDSHRLAIGKPLASPARRTLTALQMALLGR